jgi:arylsulfatase A-like enzyme
LQVTGGALVISQLGGAGCDKAAPAATPDGASVPDAGATAGDADAISEEVDSGPPVGGTTTPPNILLLIIDESMWPRYAAGGYPKDYDDVLAFEASSTSSKYATYFPARQWFVKRGCTVLDRHTIASAACVPSRAVIFTGHYPTVHGLRYTDGIGKTGDEATYPWLDPAGTPTLGDWFHAGGFDTAYIGKWHISHPEGGEDAKAPPDVLAGWGFDLWDAPDGHGAGPHGLGVYRDPAWARKASQWLTDRKASGSKKPFFLVASLLNPHDIWAYPQPFYGSAENGAPGTAGEPQPVPTKGSKVVAADLQDNLDQDYAIKDERSLNAAGFAGGISKAPPSFSDDLAFKPTVQKAYRDNFKGAFTGIDQLAGRVPIPLDASWVAPYGDFYAYLNHKVEPELAKILSALDTTGLASNTIVVMIADHGDMNGAHGGMVQKWHSAYEEVIRVPMVVAGKGIGAGVKRVADHTSHVDLLPTLLGLAGLNPTTLASKITGHQVTAPVGANLTGLILGTGGAPTLPDGTPREGAFYATHDDVTADLDGGGESALPQPNRVHAVRTATRKVARYYDGHGTGKPDEYELYYLDKDPAERWNLYWRNPTTGQVEVPQASLEALGLVPVGADAATLEAARTSVLAEAEAMLGMLATYEKAYLIGSA